MKTLVDMGWYKKAQIASRNSTLTPRELKQDGCRVSVYHVTADPMNTEVEWGCYMMLRYISGATKWAKVKDPNRLMNWLENNQYPHTEMHIVVR